MRLKNATVSNYKSFLNPTPITLQPGFNVILGKNDAGKSALLEALSLTFSDKPHRSVSTAPTRDTTIRARPKVDLVFELESNDIHSALRMKDAFLLPNTSAFTNTSQADLTTLNECVRGPEVRIFVGAWNPTGFINGHLMTFGPRTESSGWQLFQNRAAPTALSLAFAGIASPAIAPPYAHVLAEHCRNHLYIVNAERRNLGECSLSAQGRALHSDASNLAARLNLLAASNPEKFEEFLLHVRAVLPHIHRVAAVPYDDAFRIVVWSKSDVAGSHRDDLGVLLKESGTGVGQVLALLFILVASDGPQVIFIDEPQSFLHPSAIRKLYQVMTGYPQHQYILTTHATGALAEIDTPCFIHLRKQGFETVVEYMNPQSAEHVHACLGDLGARLSDVFGADTILWVEGATEEECFGLVLRRLGRQTLGGTKIRAVLSVGDLQKKKNAERVMSIYRELSTSTPLLPPAIAFVFDRECLTEGDRADISRMDPERVRWLPRRMFENYLLDAEAIKGLIERFDSDRPAPVTLSQVEDFIANALASQRYFCKGASPADQARWKETIHAAELLEDVMAELTEQRVEYRKVSHGRWLTEWLIDHPTEDMHQLKEFLLEIVARV